MEISNFTSQLISGDSQFHSSTSGYAYVKMVRIYVSPIWSLVASILIIAGAIASFIKARDSLYSFSVSLSSIPSSFVSFRSESSIYVGIILIDVLIPFGEDGEDGEISTVSHIIGIATVTISNPSTSPV